MATIQIEPLQKGGNVTRWLQRIESLMVWQGVGDEKKKHALIASLGSEAYELVADACLPDKPSDKTYNDLVSIIKKQLMSTKLPIAARYEFYQLRQGTDDIKTYVRKLRNATEECAFGAQLDDRLRDQLVMGISNKDALKRMLTEKLSDLTLDKTIEIATAFEAVQESQKKLSGNTNETVCYSKSKQNFTLGDKGGSKLTCFCCGKVGHTKDKCFMRQKNCHNCGKVGHTSAVCKLPKHSQQDEKKKIFRKHRNVRNIENEDVLFNVGQGLFHHNVSICGRIVRMVFDTGADVSIINQRVYEALQINANLPLKDRPQTIKGYGNNVIPTLGETMVQVEDNGRQMHLPVIVAKGTNPCIYGCNWIQQLRPKFSINAIRKHEVQLVLKDGTSPIFFRPRTIAFGMRDAVKEELNRLEEENILVKVQESDWATPIVPVIKPNGKIRLCGDYKVTLNPHLKDMVSTTKTIEEIVTNLAGSSWFSELDLRNAYHQLPLDEKSSYLTTISTPFGLYRHAFLPFGIKTAPAIFQATMDKIFAGMDGIEVYQDNIYVHGKSKTGHDRTLQLVKEKLKENKFTLNEAKCLIGVNQLCVLGTIVNGKRIIPDPKKTETIKNLPSPKTVKELKSFLGMVEFYGRFIPNLSHIREPLSRLTRKTENFIWSKEAANSFQKLKQILSNQPVLSMFNPGKKISLKCDASPVACAAVMEQEGKPVLYISKTLSAAERNYAQVEREALAIVWAVRRLHKYLVGSKFLLLTDNQPMKFLFSPDKSIPQVAASRIQRWAIFLMSYNFEIKHISGINNNVADHLSRNIDTSQESETFDVNSIEMPSPMVDKERVLKASRQDKLLRRLYFATKNGWSRKHIQVSLYKYAQYRNELTIVDGLLYRGNRLLIPRSLKRQVLHTLHNGHPGITSMKAISRQSVWWPGIDGDIESFCRNCNSCCLNKGQTKRMWQSWPCEEDPWSRIHVDFAGPFKNGQYALVLIDAFSKWPEVHLMPSMRASETIKRLRRTFSQEGVPQTIVSDNGPTFISAELKSWLRLVGCRQIFAPPYHPRSNGLAERFVRTLKEHINAAGDDDDLQRTVDKFLMMYRNTPHSTTNQAPATMLKGRLLRNNISSLALQGDNVLVKQRPNKQNKWKRAKIVKGEGEKIVQVELPEGGFERYHIEDCKVDESEVKIKKAEDEEIPKNSKDRSEIAEDSKDEDKNSTCEKDNIKTEKNICSERPKRIRRPPDRFQPT